MRIVVKDRHHMLVRSLGFFGFGDDAFLAYCLPLFIRGLARKKRSRVVCDNLISSHGFLKHFRISLLPPIIKTPNKAQSGQTPLSLKGMLRTKTDLHLPEGFPRCKDVKRSPKSAPPPQLNMFLPPAKW